jgi:hypothetical protein
VDDWVGFSWDLDRFFWDWMWFFWTGCGSSRDRIRFFRDWIGSSEIGVLVFQAYRFFTDIF